MTTDVLVVGAGPAGLAAAIAARQQGFQVMLVEASGAASDKCCGEGLMPDGVAALRALGVTIPSDAGRFSGVRFMADGHEARATFTNGLGLGIRRTRLNRLLTDYAIERGVVCRFHTRVTGLGPDGVRLDNETVAARWIVGADGRNSRVRQWAGLGAAVAAGSTRYGFRQHFEVARAPDLVEVHWNSRFQVFVTPVNAHEVCVAMTTADRGRRLDPSLAQLPGLRQWLGRATSMERGALTGNLSVRNVARGNVALVGDAAGTVDSITGEGMWLAFRQAAQLASAMARQDLESYARAHRRLMFPPRTVAGLLVWFAENPAPRQWAARALAACPAAFRTMLAAHAGAPAFFGGLVLRNEGL